MPSVKKPLYSTLIQSVEKLSKAKLNFYDEIKEFNETHFPNPTWVNYRSIDKEMASEYSNVWLKMASDESGLVRTRPVTKLRTRGMSGKLPDYDPNIHANAKTINTVEYAVQDIDTLIRVFPQVKALKNI